MKNRSIGIFDSGVGGLSVLSHIRASLPAEKLLYVADSAFMPYGCKSDMEIEERCLKVAAFLQQQGVKSIVVACNTATAHAIHHLRAICDYPVIGMEPAVKPAVARSRSKNIGVLVTTGTSCSEKFNRLKQRFVSQANLIVQPCPGLVELIEQGQLNSDRTRELLGKLLAPLLQQGVDTLVLGCTHYPFLIPLMRELLAEQIEIIDAGHAVAQELKRQLGLCDLHADSQQQGTVEFWSSGNSDSALMASLWGEPVQIHHFDT